MIHHDYLYQPIQTVMRANDAYWHIQRPRWRAKRATARLEDKIAAAKYLSMLRSKASTNRRQIADKRRALRAGIYLELKDIP